MTYPRLCRLRQQFERSRVDNVPATVRATLESIDLSKTIRPGQTIALTAGSRGIANIALILKEVVGFLHQLGARPFLVPTMGSHGGGTADGQRHVLESYGITEDFVGAPIRASMEVVSFGSTGEGYPVVVDRHAAEADHIGVVARIKPHTSYHGPLESGIMKMMMIGLGKHAGAANYHRILLEKPFDQVVRSVGRTILRKAPIAFGLGIVENAYDETALIEALRPNQFEEREPELLTLARTWLPRLPFHEADLLIIDEIGKDISGSGMDTNVVGRKRARGAASIADEPVMRYIFVRELTPRTHGNATGIGLADFTTDRLVAAMDYRATVINCVTAGYPDGANVPVHFETDREVLDTALSILGTRSAKDARIIHIRNTLQVEEVDASESYLDGGPLPHATVSGKSRTLAFDSAGNLPALAGEPGALGAGR